MDLGGVVSTPTGTSLRKGLLALLGSVAIALPACGVMDLTEGWLGPGFDEPPAESMSGLELEKAQEVMALMNAERAAAGLPAYVWDDLAADTAYDHAVDMRVRDYYAHRSPEGLGSADRLEAAGVVAKLTSENIAYTQDTPDDVMAAWMASDGHRRNIMSPYFTHAGVGVSLGAKGPWWVINFFTPPSAE